MTGAIPERGFLNRVLVLQNPTRLEIARIPTLDGNQSSDSRCLSFPDIKEDRRRHSNPDGLGADIVLALKVPTSIFLLI